MLLALLYLCLCCHQAVSAMCLFPMGLSVVCDCGLNIIEYINIDVYFNGLNFGILKYWVKSSYVLDQLKSDPNEGF